MTEEKDQKQWIFVSIDQGTQKATYLHFMKLDETTTNPQHAWQGTQRQGFNVRAKHPIARSLPLLRKNHK